MMNNQLVANSHPFTAQGVTDVTTELHGRSAFELLAAAAKVAANFKGFMAETFDLNTKQVEFLNGIDETTTSLIASACSFAIANSLPIYLEKGVKAIIEEEKPQLKIIRAISNLTSNSSSDGRCSAGGYVTIQISYAAQ